MSIFARLARRVIDMLPHVLRNVSTAASPYAVLSCAPYAYTVHASSCV